MILVNAKEKQSRISVYVFLLLFMYLIGSPGEPGDVGRPGERGPQGRPGFNGVDGVPGLHGLPVSFSIAIIFLNMNALF